MEREEGMRLALSEAAQSGADVPVGAVVVKDGQVIARAHNEREAGGGPFAWPWSGPAGRWGTGGCAAAPCTSPWSPAPCAPGRW